MQPGWCLMCGTAARREFVTKANDRVALRLMLPTEGRVRYAICSGCGHVYQDPMLDDEELRRLYRDDYRPMLKTGDAVAKEMERGVPVSSWVAEQVEPLVRRRTVLDIGCGSGTYLKPFKERGWEVFGIDPVPAWTDFARRQLGGTERTIVTGSYGPDCFPERKFSLILFSHTVEHIPDPVAMLRSMRALLEDDGILFVATPNLLDPPMERLTSGFLAGAHVRLYSPGALARVLAQSGFRVEKKADFHSNFGLGVMARPADDIADIPPDDPMAILQLYGALLQPLSARTLGRNLAALTRRHWWLLPTLCRQLDVARYRFETDGHRVRAVRGATPAGPEVPILREEEDRRLDACGEDLPEAFGSDDATVVQLGLGWGTLALEINRRLRGAQHLFIWEADQTLAKQLMKVRDLSPLWESERVTLVLGESLHAPADRRRRMLSPSTLYVTGAARRWNRGLYRSFMDRVKMGEMQPAAVEAAAGHW